MNATVIQVNAERFRLALMLLVGGLIYGTLATTLLVAQLRSVVLEGGLFVVVSLITGGIVYYVLTERYKVEQSQQESNNE